MKKIELLSQKSSKLDFRILVFLKVEDFNFDVMGARNLLTTEIIIKNTNRVITYEYYDYQVNAINVQKGNKDIIQIRIKGDRYNFQWIWMPKYYGCYRFNSGIDAYDRAVAIIRADELVAARRSRSQSSCSRASRSR